MLEVINQQYIMTARAKGLSEKKVIFVHAFRNSLIPLITLMATLLPALLGGTVIVESIFSIPGMGMLSFEAILSRDIPVIMAITTIAAILTLMGILLADLMYSLVDPRIRLEANMRRGYWPNVWRDFRKTDLPWPVISLCQFLLLSPYARRSWPTASPMFISPRESIFPSVL